MKNTASLHQRAIATIEANLVQTRDGVFLVAGGHQFKTLWVRDFCFSVPGLLAAGYSDLVNRQLALILRFRGPSGFLPRGLDVTNPKLRVVANLIGRSSWVSDYKNAPLMPEYLGEHGTPAFDSNLLFVLAALKVNETSRQEIYSHQELLALLSIYQTADGLLHQSAFSDWQDSVRRSGALLFTQLMYLACLLALKEDNQADQLRAAIRKNFFRSGRFFEQSQGERISLESQAFLLTNQALFPELDHPKYFQALKSHPIWSTDIIPGRPVFPPHPSSEVSWTTKAVGLRHYHDGFVWGWLSAEACRCARLMRDINEADRISSLFNGLTGNEKFISEIYTSKKSLTPAKTWIYKSESPFTWSAAKWLEALL